MQSKQRFCTFLFMHFLQRLLFSARFIPPISTRMTSSPSGSSVRLLGQEEAIAIDQELFNEYKFSVDQLMELAGLSVAAAVAQVYGKTHGGRRVLAIAGPGNNGGDAMVGKLFLTAGRRWKCMRPEMFPFPAQVAARHLRLFGFQNVTLLPTREPNKELFQNLVHQARESGVQVTFDPKPFLTPEGRADLILDGLFGFSFKPPVRPDFVQFMEILSSGSQDSPVVSIDIPSGWDVEKGPPQDVPVIQPQMLVSLTAPKKCASFFKGPHHFLGGRFVPEKLADKYQLGLPAYPGTDCVVRIGS